METGEYLCDLTKRIWQYYLLEPTKENFEELYKLCPENLVMIGTGKHEFFTDLAHAVRDLQKNQLEAASIRFEVLDEWYESLKVTDDVYIVYGGLWARQLPQKDTQVLVDMDTRFSAVFRRRGKIWMLVHLHHSVPNAEQSNGEFYPKTIAQQASEALALAKLFQRRSELDLMTGVYNHESFRNAVQQKLDENRGGILVLFDIDNFKQFNDKYGHLSGDSILKLFAKLLGHIFKGGCIGRVGGDEFAVFYPEATKQDTIEILLQTLRREFSGEAETLVENGSFGFSAGIAGVTADTPSFTEVFDRADKALYRVKKEGKDSYRFYV